MQLKTFHLFKWILYILATLALCFVQSAALDHLEINGVTPFIYPILAALVPMFEGGREGPVFSLLFGLLCDLLLYSPAPGFFTILFTLTALIAAVIGENLLRHNFFCGLLVSAVGVGLTGGARIVLHILAGGGHVALMGRFALWEAGLSLPAIVLALPLYRTIHRRCTLDY